DGIRYAAAISLAKLENGSFEVLQVLFAALNDENWQVRSSAAQALVQLRNSNAEVIEGLLADLKNEDQETYIRSSAALAVVKPSVECFEGLLCGLKDKDSHVIDLAVKALGDLQNRSPEIVEGLLRASQDENKVLSFAAQKALEMLENPSAEIVETLLRLLKDKNSDVRSRAAYALDKLQNAGANVVEGLVAALKDSTASVGSAAAYALGKLQNAGANVVEGLVAALKDSTASVRSSAAHALGKLHNPTTEVIEALLGVLKDEEPSVRLITAEALAELQNSSTEVVEVLLFELRSKAWLPELSSAAKALGLLQNSSPEVVKGLIRAQKDDYHGTRSSAVQVLAQLENPSAEVIEGMLAALKNEDSAARRSAAEALGKLSNPDAKVIEGLIDALNDKSVEVRDRAAEALGKLQNPSVEKLEILLRVLNGLKDNQHAIRVVNIIQQWITRQSGILQSPENIVLKNAEWFAALSDKEDCRAFFENHDATQHDILLTAIQHDNAGLVKWMIEHEIPTICNHKNSGHYLLEAVSLRFVNVVQVLLPYFNVHLETKNEAGQTPLLLAAHLGDGTLIKLLLDAGADFEAKDHQGHSFMEILNEQCSDKSMIEQVKEELHYHVVMKQLIAMPQKSNAELDYHHIAFDEIKFDDSEEAIGEGSYGVIHKGEWHGISVAVKQLKLKKLSVDLARSYEREAQLMSKCHFPHIVRLYGACTKAPHYAMVMEYLPKGALRNVLEDTTEALSWVRRWQIAIDIAAGLDYLHSRNILHRDLSSNNVLLDDNYRAKIGDFGQSKLKEHTATMTLNVSTSSRWRAPELADSKKANTKASDIYSLGMILWELSTRQLPYGQCNDFQIAKILHDISISKQSGEAIDYQPISDDCPAAFAALIRACWQEEGARPSAGVLLKKLQEGCKEAMMYQIELDKKPWHVGVKAEKSHLKPYQIIEAGKEDIEKVLWAYQHHPVEGMDIGEVQVIVNPALEKGFEARLSLLQQRANQPAFAARWQEDNEAPVRKEVMDYGKALTVPYAASDYPEVKLMPVWHGTKPEVLESLYSTGYANLALTDSGFFGKGIYGAVEASYAHRVYGKGALLLSWFSWYSAYPVISGDSKKLRGKANFSNYDAHFIPVVPETDSPNENCFYPPSGSELPRVTEMVVFEAAQALPRYQVGLVKRTPEKPIKLLGQSPYGLFRHKAKTSRINLYEAAECVYRAYLSKAYTVKKNLIDWEYKHQLYSNLSVTIPRPNHGLAHTLRTMSYVPFVIEQYLSYQQNLSAKEIKCLQDHGTLIQLALLFYVTGRANEAGHAEGNLYKRFRQDSAKNFKKFLEEVKSEYAISEDIKNECVVAIEQGYYTPVEHVFTDIICLCHDLDTLRCFDEAKFETTLRGDIARLLGEGGAQKLKALALKCLELTGDRIMGDNDYAKDYDGPRFIECSQNVATCFHFIDIAIREWQEHCGKKSLTDILLVHHI
ncbi:MAG: protein kinase, partial [Gammaproteobacteria bacterium]